VEITGLAVTVTAVVIVLVLLAIGTLESYR
jgi:hypothetical protein